MTDSSAGLPLSELGRQALAKLYMIAEDEATQEKNRIEIYKWIAEMALGKPSVPRQEATPQVSGTVRFEGELEDWAG